MKVGTECHQANSKGRYRIWTRYKVLPIPSPLCSFKIRRVIIKDRWPIWAVMLDRLIRDYFYSRSSLHYRSLCLLNPWFHDWKVSPSHPFISQASAAKNQKPTRHIPSMPERILDAPNFLDDYYLNLLDWWVQKVGHRHMTHVIFSDL